MYSICTVHSYGHTLHVCRPITIERYFIRWARIRVLDFRKIKWVRLPDGHLVRIPHAGVKRR